MKKKTTNETKFTNKTQSGTKWTATKKPRRSRESAAVPGTPDKNTDGDSATETEIVRSAAGLLYRLFEDKVAGHDWRYNGQSLYERCEGWVLHAVDQLEQECEYDSPSK